MRTFISRIQTRQIALIAANNALEKQLEDNPNLEYVDIKCMHEEMEKNNLELTLLFSVMEKLNEISNILVEIV